MLDSNIEKNSEYDRRLTAQLYGGNPEMRLQQEIILGIGGVKMLDALGIQVTVVHMNEGHSAFTPFERARALMKKNGLGFAEAHGIGPPVERVHHPHQRPGRPRRLQPGNAAELFRQLPEGIQYFAA